MTDWSFRNKMFMAKVKVNSFPIDEGEFPKYRHHLMSDFVAMVLGGEIRLYSNEECEHFVSSSYVSVLYLSLISSTGNPRTSPISSI